MLNVNDTPHEKRVCEPVGACEAAVGEEREPKIDMVRQDGYINVSLQ